MIKILSEEKFNEWDDFVFNHRYGTIYHTSHWFSIIKNTYHLQPVVIVEYQNGIKCGIPFFLHNSLLWSKRLISITNAQACNPLVNNINQLENLIGFILNFIKKENIYFAELRVTEDFEYNSPGLTNRRSEFSTYVLSLDQPYDQIKLNYHKNCIQRPLKKANSYNLKLIKGRDLNDMKIFYALYETMRRDKGLLPQPFSFYSNLWHFLSPKNLCEVFHASYKGQIISSVINLKYKDKYTYEYGSTNKLYIKYHPSHFLIDYSIKTAVSEDFKIFDLGRTENSNYGLIDFKRRWGGEKLEFHYYYLPPNMQKNVFFNKKIEKMASIFISHIPKSVYHQIGQFLYKITF